MPDELEIIANIRARVRKDNRVAVGIGDDAAVITTSGGVDLLACCDLMVEDVHFRRQWAPPRFIGHKALASTLSDVAAMGGAAKFAMVSIALPHDLPPGFAEDLFSGLFGLADSCGVSIVGGDTSSSTGSLFIDVNVIGECSPGRAVKRSGARAGDAIYVTGSLGASALGLMLLERGFRLDGDSDQSIMTAQRREAILKHLAPQPRLDIGRGIGEPGLAGAMIDVSDGLSTDLCHILEESRVGAIIHADTIPIANSARSLSHEFDVDPFQLALHGGEEYELLLTGSPAHGAALATLSAATGIPITHIGEIVAEEGLQLERSGVLAPVQPAGYQHRI